MSSEDRIAAVRAVTVALPIPRPLQLGAMRIDCRRYVVVRVDTADGVTGWAAALSRDCPVAAIVNDVLAPLLSGADSAQLETAIDRCRRATVAAGRVGLVARAISLVEIALWDARGKRAGQPVWRLLADGDHDYRPAELPVVLVAAYPSDETVEEVAERLGDLARRGYGLLKLSRRSDPATTRTTLAGIGAELPEGAKLVVDAGWWWTDADEATAELKEWAGSAPLAWVEDPLVPEDIDGYARIVASGLAPIGAGDELTDPRVAAALVERAGVHVARIEAPCIGGLGAAVTAARRAAASGASVSLHVYPEIHAHVAVAVGGAVTVETFATADNPWDPASRLWLGSPDPHAGLLPVPTAPGLGYDIDTELVAAHLEGPGW